jgi:hypothetical protein
MNQFIRTKFRPFVNYFQNDWSVLLPYLDFAYATQSYKSTGLSPFEVELGYLPRMLSTDKLGHALKLLLETGCSISRLKPSPNDGRKQWLSPGRSSARSSRNTKNKPTAIVGRSIGKQKTKFIYAKATELPIAFPTNWTIPI